MASNLIFRIASQYETKGTDDAAKGLEEVRQQMLGVDKAAASAAVGFREFRSILGGTILTLPLIKFVNDARAGQSAIENLSMQVKSLGSEFDRVNFDQVANKVRGLAGVTDTELATALKTGLVYFKDVGKELNLLDTALGISQVRGISLASAYQQLGLIQQGYGQRILRQLGVSVDKNIKDPNERAADSIRKLTALYAPLAGGAETVDKEFKKLGASINNAGEALGKNFIVPLQGALKWFNDLDDSTKRVTIQTIVLTASVLGLATAYKALASATTKNVFGQVTNDLTTLLTMSIRLRDLPAMFSLLGATLKTLVIPAAIITTIASLTKVADALRENRDAQKELIQTNKDRAKAEYDAAKASIGDIGTEIALSTELDGVLKDLIKTRTDLGRQILQEKAQGRPDLVAETEAQIKETQKRIESIQSLEEFKRKTGFKTDDELTKDFKKATLSEHDYALFLIQDKFAQQKAMYVLNAEQQRQIDVVRAKEIENANKEELKRQQDQQKEIINLRLSLLKGSKQTEIAAAKASLLEQIQAEFQQRSINIEKIKALEEKASKDIRDIKLRYAREEIDKELEFALMSKDEQVKYTNDLMEARKILAQASVQDISDMTDAEKELLKTRGGSVALEETRQRLAEEKARVGRGSSTREEKADAEAIIKELENQIKLHEKLLDLKQNELNISLKAKTEIPGLTEPGKTLTGTTIEKQFIGTVELSPTLNFTITPNAGELSNVVSEKVRVEIQGVMRNFENNMRKFLSRQPNQT